VLVGEVDEPLLPAELSTIQHISWVAEDAPNAVISIYPPPNDTKTASKSKAERKALTNPQHYIGRVRNIFTAGEYRLYDAYPESQGLINRPFARARVAIRVCEAWRRQDFGTGRESSAVQRLRQDIEPLAPTRRPRRLLLGTVPCMVRMGQTSAITRPLR
jgi:hypothetical protein